jgi:Nucleotide-binding protein implicated in inhibition of septum formation
MADTHNKIVLASSSKYRKEQLKQLNLSFVTQSPDIDETAYVNENAVDLVSRLAQSKAQAIAGNHPKSLIIGADQVLVGPLNKGQDINSLSHQFIIGKSGGFEKAFRQLKSLQNQEAELVSGLALYNSDTDSLQQSTCRHRIVYRKLTDAQIETLLTS